LKENLIAAAAADEFSDIVLNHPEFTVSNEEDMTKRFKFGRINISNVV